jgi:hypothetical protein
MKTRKHLTNGEWAALIRDFENTFATDDTGDDRVRPEGLFNWTTQTGAVYAWLWPRYVESYVTKGHESGRLASAVFSGLFNGLRNQSSVIARKLSFRTLYDTAELVHKHYLGMLRENYPNTFIPNTVEELERHRERSYRVKPLAAK